MPPSFSNFTLCHRPRWSDTATTAVIYRTAQWPKRPVGLSWAFISARHLFPINRENLAEEPKRDLARSAGGGGDHFRTLTAQLSGRVDATNDFARACTHKSRFVSRGWATSALPSKAGISSVRLWCPFPPAGPACRCQRKMRLSSQLTGLWPNSHWRVICQMIAQNRLSSRVWSCPQTPQPP